MYLYKNRGFSVCLPKRGGKGILAISEFLQRLTVKEDGETAPLWDGCSASQALERQQKNIAAAGRETLRMFRETGGLLFAGNYKEARALLRQPDRFTAPLVRTAEEIESLLRFDLTSAELSRVGQLQWVTACIRRVGVSARDLASIAAELNGKTFSAEGGKELESYLTAAASLLEKALSVFEENSFDRIRSLQELEEAAEEQETALRDHYFQRLGEECKDPGVAFLSVSVIGARCCELAGEIACAITGREKL